MTNVNFEGKERTIGGFVEGVVGVKIINEEAVSKMDLPIFVGFLEDGTPKIVDLANNTSAVIAGESGTGKTFELLTILGSLLYAQLSSDVKIELIDTQRSVLMDELGKIGNVTLTDAKWASYDQVDVTDVLNKLRSLKEEVHNRRTILFDARKESWRGLRNSFKKSGDVEGLADHPFIVVALDDVTRVMRLLQDSPDVNAKSDYDEFLNNLADIASNGRSVGIHVVVVGHRTIANSMPKDVMLNSSLKIGFKLTSSDMERLLPDRDVLNDLPTNLGEAYVTDFALAKPIKINVPMIGEVDEFGDVDAMAYVGYFSTRT